MKINIKFFIITFVILVVCVMNIFADTTNIKQVSIRVEGTTKTIMEGVVKSDTFARAVQKLADEFNIEVIMKNDSKGQKLYSIDGIVNNTYGKNDKWNCYILRKGNIVEVENVDDNNILIGDELVVYYGNENTKIITNIEEKYKDDKLTIQLLSNTVTWFEDKGIWSPKTVSNHLENIIVHMLTGDGKIVTQKTDSYGKVTFNIKGPTICSYYVDDFKTDDIPIIVKVPIRHSILGIDNNKLLTKAEFTAILVNYFGLVNNDLVKLKSFGDVKNTTEYTEQIYIATSNHIVRGDENGNFNPNKEITMQEMAVALYTIFGEINEVNEISVPNQNEVLKTLNGSSKWAEPYISGLIELNIIKNGIYDWTSYVTAEKLMLLLFE